MKTELFDIFTPQQLQAIKDAIIYGAWAIQVRSFTEKMVCLVKLITHGDFARMIFIKAVILKTGDLSLA